MAESLPSAKTVIADVPEVRDFRAKFVYNFFQPDERINGTGKATREFVQKRSSENFDAEFIESDKFNRFTARFIRLDWRPVILNPGARVSTLKPAGFTIAGNFEKIHEEQHFVGNDFTNITMQDNGIDEKMRYFVKQLRDRQEERDRLDAIELAVTASAQESPLDLVKRMNSKVSQSIDPAILCESMIDPDLEGYIFKDKDGQAIDNTTLLKELGQVKHYAQLNNKVIASVAKSVSENSISVFADEVKAFLPALNDMQEKALAEKNSDQLNAKDFDLEIVEFVDYTPLDASGHAPRVEIIGYLIEKVEISPQGNAEVLDPIIIESPNVGVTVDVQVKYGYTYNYTVRSIAMFESQAEDEESEESVVLKYLVASKPSPSQLIPCIETLPPPAPSDFGVRWDPIEKAAVLEWAFPVNTQRDIKGWQIFRRASTSEPFELQVQYNFDDSVVPGRDSRAEFPHPELIQKMKSPKQFYIDKGFTKESTYIYAVCSIDARGLSSNYSAQVQGSFNRFKNRMEKKLVSVKDAPKPYPNFFMAEDAFVDSIKDSGHKKLRIVFNPEYLKVIDSDANDLQLLKTTKDANYQLSLINVDLQIQQNINIKLLNKTRSKDQDIRKKRLLQNRRNVFDRLKRTGRK